MFNPITYVRQKIKEYNSDIDTRPTSALYDLVIIPLSLIYASIKAEIDYIMISRSISNAEYLPDDEMDLLASNLFITRRSGTLSKGVVYYYFSEPIDTTIPKGAQIESEDGLIFIVDEAVIISHGAMSVNMSYGMYYLSVNVTAAGYGEEYNLAAEKIIRSIFSVPNAIKVTNPNAIAGGGERESNVQMAERMRTAITSRNLITKRSINTTLLDTYPFITEIQTVGFGDEDMVRDTQVVVVNSTDYTMHMGGCVDVYIKTGAPAELTIEVDSEEHVALSKTRAVGLLGEFQTSTEFVDTAARFDLDAIKEDDILTVYNNIAKGAYRISSVDPGQLTTKDEAENSASNLEYMVESSSSNITSPMVAIKSVNQVAGSTLTALSDGSIVDVEPKELISRASLSVECMLNDSLVSAYVYDDKLMLNYFSSILDAEDSGLEISALATSFPESIISVGTDSVALVWSDSGTIKVSIVNISTMTLTLERDVIANGVTYEYRNPVVTSSFHDELAPIGTSSYYVNVFYDEVDPAGSSYNINVTSMELDFTAQTLVDVITDVHIGLSRFGVTPYALTCSGNDEYTAVFAMDSQQSGGIVIVDNNFSSIGAEKTITGTEISSIAITMDIDSNIYSTWLNSTSHIMSFQMTVQQPLLDLSGEVVSSLGKIIYQNSTIDISGMKHIAYVVAKDNYGDVKYIKLGADGRELLVDDVIADSAKNISKALVLTDSFRRPTFTWNAFDPYKSYLMGSRKLSQDYALEVADPNTRFSSMEILGLLIDPAVASGTLEVTYYQPSNFALISDVVSSRDSVDRVVTSNYLVKAFVPCLLDMKIVYNGTRETEDLVSDMGKYISEIMESEIYASDIITALKLDSSEDVDVPFVMTAKLHNIDGTVTITRSEDGFKMNDIVRFIPGLIEVERQVNE